MNDNFEKLLDEEVEKRISEMEAPGYEFPKRFSKKDYIVTAAVILLCLAAVIAGGFLS